MDSLIAAAARALAAGDALGALKHVALRDDPAALALRGIAMAQLGEWARARKLLRQAAQRFGAKAPVSRARCLVAEAEVALALRDLAGPPRALLATAATLEDGGDRANAQHARLMVARKLLLIGRLDEAADVLDGLDVRGLPPTLEAIAALARAELAMRALHVAPARKALDEAQDAAARAGVPALQAEVAEARSAFDRPAARRLSPGGGSPLRLHEVAALIESGALVVDGCRYGVRVGDTWLPMAKRPVLFTLARALAEAWPKDIDREALIERAFRTRRPDETHRARLRVEVGRLRRMLAPVGQVQATTRGFVLKPDGGRPVVVLAPPIDGAPASLLALLSDGASWSTSALALALDTSQRTVQRALLDLEAQGRVRSIGKARAQRWLAPPLTGFTTTLLLPAGMPFA